MHHYYDMNDYLRGVPVKRFSNGVNPSTERVDLVRPRDPIESSGTAEGRTAEGEDSSSFYVFNTHAEAEEAIRSLDSSGFDVKKLSLVGKGCHEELGRSLPDQAKYEADLKADKYILMVHGSAGEVRHAHVVLTGSTHPASAPHAG